MAAAREALERGNGSRPLLIGVTILTSMGEADLAEIGLAGSPADNVQRLAGLARTAGLDGVVCSPQESRQLADQLGGDFVLVTPGVRPTGSATDDQQRILTPAAAFPSLAGGAAGIWWQAGSLGASPQPPGIFRMEPAAWQPRCIRSTSDRSRKTPIQRGGVPPDGRSIIAPGAPGLSRLFMLLA